MAVLAGVMLVVGARMVGLGAGGQPEEGDVAAVQLEKLVFVTENNRAAGPGCQAVSAFSIDSERPLFQGPPHWDLERLTGAFDLSVVLGMSYAGEYLYGVWRPQGSRVEWLADTDIRGATFATALGVMPDNETLLVGRRERRNADQPYEYWVGKYHLSDLRRGQIGPELGRFNLESLPVEILVDPDGRRFHVVTFQARLHTVDASTMTEAAAPIQMRRWLAPFPGPFATAEWPNPERPPDLADATITGDGHYLIANRLDVPEVNVADLVARKVAQANPGNVLNGGLAANRGWHNAGLLAIHAVDYVAVYRFEPPATLTELGRLAINSPQHFDYTSGVPRLAIAWSGSGSHIIATTEHNGKPLVVIRVEDGGRRLIAERYVAVCENPPGLKYPDAPRDILTANGMITPPWPTPSATGTATATSTATPPHTPTAPPTAAPSGAAGRLWLPWVERG